MISFKKSLIAACAMLAGSAYATPEFVVGVNSVNFVAYENQYRTEANCIAYGGCIGASVGTGVRMVDPSLTGVTSIVQGDLFVGVFKVTQTEPANWGPTTTDNFTGYFVQEVASFTPLGGTNVLVNLTAGADPFATGKLAAGEMFALYTDSSTNFNPNGTLASSISKATDGVKWAGLGLTGSETYAYSRQDLSVAASSVTDIFGKTLMSLDVVSTGPSYNLNTLEKVNDQSETLLGGTTSDTKLKCTAADLLSASVTCADIVGNADIKRNASFDTGVSPWYFEVNDPLSLSMVPEPGALALVGVALAGLGFSTRRRGA